MNTRASALVFASFLAILGGCHSTTAPENVQDSSKIDNTQTAKTAVIKIHDEAEQSTGANIFVTVEIDSLGAPVSLPYGDTILCNGIALALDESAGSYEAAVPIQPTGVRYTFVYQKDGLPKFLADAASHDRPKITSPISDAAIARTKDFVINYASETGTAGITSSVHSDPVVLNPKSAEPDNGTSAQYDLTSLPAGTGLVQVIRHYQTTHTDLGFKSIEANYYVGKAVGVVWQ